MPRRMLQRRSLVDRVGRWVRHTQEWWGLVWKDDGMWVGMRLDTPTGLNNGTVGGVSYFSCKEKHGLFSRAGRITIIKLPWNIVDDTEGESDEGDNEGVVRSVLNTHSQ